MLSQAAKRDDTNNKWDTSLKKNFKAVEEITIPREVVIPPFAYINVFGLILYGLFDSAALAGFSVSISSLISSVRLADSKGLLVAILVMIMMIIVMAIFSFFLGKLIRLGLWHIMAPLRSLIEGNKTVGGFIGESAMLIGTSALVGFKFVLMGKITGNLYMGMGDHFVNNTIVNILHVINKENEADQLQVIRISIAQSVSFIAVLIWFFIDKKLKAKAATQQEAAI